MKLRTRAWTVRVTRGRLTHPVTLNVERNRFAEKGISSKAVFVLLDG